MATTADSKQPTYVNVSALDGGHLTLPERLFVTDPDPEKRSTVPSLSFLIQHPSALTPRGGKATRLVFDLGVKRDQKGYSPAQQAHIAQRQPVITTPDCADSLRHGCNEGENNDTKVLLEPSRDIDLVILSHVHWDHVGTPSDFSGATFLVGAGTLDLLKNGAGPLYPAELFNNDELPASRTIELPPVSAASDKDYDAAPHAPKYTKTTTETGTRLPKSADNWTWKPLGGFPSALDLFGDGSLFIIDSPGHLYGHVNLLARLGERRYVYLGGDCCHDPRILRGEKGIATYEDGRGGMRSVHVHTGVAKDTLDKIREFVAERTKEEEVEIEIVVAHDGVWRERNRHRFWPGTL